jgi:hypothetical protein
MKLNRFSISMLWFYDTNSSVCIFQSTYDLKANYKVCGNFVRKVQQTAGKKELSVIGAKLFL